MADIKDKDGNSFNETLRQMGITPPPEDSHYVDNKELYRHLKMYEDARKEAEANGTEKPRLDDYIGESIMKIATHLAFRPNFSGYSYRNEMISDAIENCVRYIDSFDCSKSTNPFSYITQICWTSFIRRITLEKSQSLVRGKLMMQMTLDDSAQFYDEDDQKLVEDVQTNVHTFVTLAYEEEEKRKAKMEEKKKIQEQKKRDAYVPNALEEMFL